MKAHKLKPKYTNWRRSSPPYWVGARIMFEPKLHKVRQWIGGKRLTLWLRTGWRADAMYAAGAEAMRERAAKECERVAKVEYDDMYGAPYECATNIRALPITPTNTEGEQA